MTKSYIITEVAKALNINIKNIESSALGSLAADMRSQVLGGIR